MSVGVSGMICLNDGDIKSKEKVSLEVVKGACDKKIGCKMGGNVSREIFENYKNEIDKNIVLFELMDTPLDITADELFCYQTYDKSEKFTLTQRLRRVEGFLTEIMKNSIIYKIIVDINYWDGFKEKTIEIKVDKFEKEVASLYIEGSVHIPVVRVIVDKEDS